MNIRKFIKLIILLLNLKKGINLVMNKSKRKLFSINYCFTLEEFKKMVKNIPEIYWSTLKYYLYIELSLILLISNICKLSIIYTFLICILLLSLTIIIYRKKIESWVEKIYKNECKKNNLNLIIDFYNNYLIISNNSNKEKINYLDIIKLIETETNLYLKCKTSEKFISIIKEDCSLEQLDFIRKIADTSKMNRKTKNKNISNR